MFTVENVIEILRPNNGYVTKHESQFLEFKEQFNFANLAEIMKDFVAFSNNQGGCLICGVQDKPRKPLGLSPQSIDQVEKMDPGRINGDLLGTFSEPVDWSYDVLEIGEKKFVVFFVNETTYKPIIAIKDFGKNQEIREGEIYFRYGGRTQKIRANDLHNIIEERIAKNNRDWVDLISKIATIGVENTAILDLMGGTIEKGQKTVFIDEEVLEKVKIIKQGSFDDTKGYPSLKLIGDLVPVNRVDVIRREKLTKAYPLSAKELAKEVIKLDQRIHESNVWRIIKEEQIKSNESFSAYVFKSDSQEKTYISTGNLPKSVPSIYNYQAVKFIVSKFAEKQEN
jgi:predicted HTH transcriptional regulator